MHDRIDGQRNFEIDDFGRKRALTRKGALIAGDMIGARFFAVLDRDLHVVEAGVGKLAQRRRGDADRGRDQIGVKAGLVRGGRDLDKIAARARLAAREMNLQDAEAGGFLEYARPGLGVELVGARFERQRVRAVRTAERATMRQLGQQAERAVQFCVSSRHISISLFLLAQRHGRTCSVEPRLLIQRRNRCGRPAQGREMAAIVPTVACRPSRAASSSHRPGYVHAAP